MNIVVVAEHYPPSPGGVATSAQRIARGLCGLGHKVQVLCFDHSRPLDVPDYVVLELDQGIEVARLGPFFLKQDERALEGVSEKVRAVLRRRLFQQMLRICDPDVQIVFSMYLLNAGFMAQYLARARGVPIVAGVRGNDIGRNIFNVERFAVIQWVVEGANRVVCVNNHLRERLLLAFPGARSKASVIPNSCPLPELAGSAGARDRLLQATSWPEDSLLVAFIGTLREKKGAEVLLKGVREAAEVAPVRLLIIGPELGGLERRICGDLWEELQDRHVLYCTGYLARPEVSTWAIGCDCVCIPSLDDGLANGLLEGMALGLCPIGSGVFSDVIRHGSNGIVVETGDAASLSTALVRLAGDADLRQRLAVAAQRSTVEYRPRDEARAYESLLSRVLEELSETLQPPAVNAEACEQDPCCH